MTDKTNISVVNSVAEATVVTHPAPHHGDETAAIAIVRILEGSVSVLRTRNPQLIGEAAEHGATIVDVGGVYDVDGGRFDHHQRGFSEAREDGTVYSSAGLLWKEYGADVCVEITGCSYDQAAEAAAKVDEVLIKGIDATDNGAIAPGAGGVLSISQAVSFLNPNWNEFGDTDTAFQDACELMFVVLVRTIESCVATVRGRDAVEEAIETSENGVMVLPQYIGGWIETATASVDPKAEGILYGVFRNLQGQWNVQALPPKEDPRAQRKPLPEAWRGLNGAALQEATGVEDAVFCHAGGFICGAKSREGALALAEAAVEAE